MSIPNMLFHMLGGQALAGEAAIMAINAANVIFFMATSSLSVCIVLLLTRLVLEQPQLLSFVCELPNQVTQPVDSWDVGRIDMTVRVADQDDGGFQAVGRLDVIGHDTPPGTGREPCVSVLRAVF